MEIPQQKMTHPNIQPPNHSKRKNRNIPPKDGVGIRHIQVNSLQGGIAPGKPELPSSGHHRNLSVLLELPISTLNLKGAAIVLFVGEYQGHQQVQVSAVQRCVHKDALGTPYLC